MPKSKFLFPFRIEIIFRSEIIGGSLGLQDVTLYIRILTNPNIQSYLAYLSTGELSFGTR